MALATSLATVAAGPVAQIINEFGSRKVNPFYLANLENNQTLSGQFSPIDTKENIDVSWQAHTTLGRQNPILQYLHGNADQLQFIAYFHAEHEGSVLGEVLSRVTGGVSAEDDRTPEQALEVLKSWARRDKDLGRPPRLTFFVGDGKLAMSQCVITSLGVSYPFLPKHNGGIRGVSIEVSLQQHVDFTLEVTEPIETRYHNVKTGEYYELITYNEYGSAIMGDIIRKRHPEKQELTEGDIVKLPSIDAINKTNIEPTSIPFYNGYTTKDSDSKMLRKEWFERNDINYFSTIIPAGL